MGSSLLWDGWNEVPSASGPLGQTNVGPAAVGNTSGISVVLIAQGLDRAVWFNTTHDGQNWSGWKSMGGQTDFAPCVITGTPGQRRRDGVWVWATGTNPPGHIFQNQSIDGRSFGRWSELGGGGVAIAAPATTLWGHILVPGTDKRIYIKKSLVDDSPFTILPPGNLLTTQGLCLVQYLGPGI